MNLFLVICMAMKSVRFKIVVCDKQRSDYQDLSYNPAQKYFRQLKSGCMKFEIKLQYLKESSRLSIFCVGLFQAA